MKVVLENDNMVHRIRTTKAWDSAKKNRNEKCMALKRSGVIVDTRDTVAVCGRRMPQAEHQKRNRE